jgi:hypothetical protein
LCAEEFALRCDWCDDGAVGGFDYADDNYFVASGAFDSEAVEEAGADLVFVTAWSVGFGDGDLGF